MGLEEVAGFWLETGFVAGLEEAGFSEETGFSEEAEGFSGAGVVAGSSTSEVVPSPEAGTDTMGADCSEETSSGAEPVLLSPQAVSANARVKMSMAAISFFIIKIVLSFGAFCSLRY